MPRRTKEEVQAAKERFIEARADVVARYNDGESAAALAAEFGVHATWFAERLDEWEVPRRDPSAASVVRGPLAKLPFERDTQPYG
ncbi:hypothetical protein OG875_13785 [Streptomyces sp. NBC_01498]|uniref:hypothetical protein n=1 Tax=Streptomyces sp. NBC_01498 TaxID=2975870 RepID=UPI002E7B0795|nr:hypothetical protein [Streptomyces sp. NBC_01498]WTL25571.1 hypothetical protein OG875_13785 [Streptomyces sp. NBC_01498]